MVPRRTAGSAPGAEALLGIGSTLGIVLQLLVLLPYLRAAGFSYRPRFDFRGSGLGHTLRLGTWTVLFVIVNQVAYTVVVRLASGGTVAGAGSGSGQAQGTGYTIYCNSFLLTMLPHSVITVSLATAMLPLLSAYAAEGDRQAIGRAVGSTLRSAYALVVPFAVVLALTALDVAQVVWGYGSAAADFANFAPSLAAVRARPGAVHHPLPDAARLLRPGADPSGVLDPVRHRGHQHRRRPGPGPTAHPPPRRRRGWSSPTPAAYAVGALTVLRLLLSRQVGGLGGRGDPALPGPAGDRRRPQRPPWPAGCGRGCCELLTARGTAARRPRPRRRRRSASWPPTSGWPGCCGSPRSVTS